MSLTYREDYWDDRERKTAFLNFMIPLFRLDLSPWDKRGFWDHNYRPFSFFDGPCLVSNVCVYSMDMVVLGRRCRVAQISAVGTRPEYRRRGLSRELTERALAWARDSHEFFFLFADHDAFPFYQSCGFRGVAEYKSRVAVRGQPPSAGAFRLDMTRDDHIQRVHDLAIHRTPVSDLLGVLNDRLFMFWCLCGLHECVYEIPDLGIAVLLRQTNGLLTIFDIVGPNVPTFARLYPYLCNSETRAVELLFMPDKLRVGETELICIDDNGTHLLGSVPFEGNPFLFPFTAHA